MRRQKLFYVTVIFISLSFLFYGCDTIKSFWGGEDDPTKTEKKKKVALVCENH